MTHQFAYVSDTAARRSAQEAAGLFAVTAPACHEACTPADVQAPASKWYRSPEVRRGLKIVAVSCAMITVTHVFSLAIRKALHA